MGYTMGFWVDVLKGNRLFGWCIIRDKAFAQIIKIYFFFSIKNEQNSSNDFWMTSLGINWR